MSANSQVVFRLPSESQFQFIEQGIGEDIFILRPYDKRLQKQVIRGKIHPISSTELTDIVSSWNLPDYYPYSDSMRYQDLVLKGKASIQSGQFEKVVLARNKDMASGVSVSELLLRLSSAYPDAYIYGFAVENVVMVGASPETLLRKDSGVLSTEALGGTLTHGKYTEKENKEHVQIVAYLEAMLGRMAYSYERLPLVRKLAGPVEHLHTGFRILSKGLTSDLNLLEALHPTPAVCGMPYKEANDFIELEEGLERGYYSGYSGPCYSDENFMMFVNLRCARVFDGYYRIIAGAGINEFSDPEDEFQETENKMNTIAQWLK